MSPTIYTYSGTCVHLLDPHPDMIVWDDVYRALAYENRYGGHTEQPFSVGQHTIALCKYLKDAPLTVRRVAFIHDFPEYVLKDVIAPLKPLLGLHYTRLTTAWENAICDKLEVFDGPFMRRVMTADVTSVDKLCWQAESELLQPNRPDHFGLCEDEYMLDCVYLAMALDPEEVRRRMAHYMKELFA